MGWKDLITSNKNTLFTITIGRKISDDLLWLKETPNVWKATWSWESGLESFPAYGLGSYGFGIFGKSGDVDIESENDLLPAAGSFEVAGDDYLQVYSIGDCDSTVDSFYFDVTEQVIYVHYNGYLPDINIAKKIGELFGFSIQAEMINGVYYEPLITSVPDMTLARDDLFDSITKYGGGTVQCDNKNGHFNYFNDEDIYGKRCQILIGEYGSGDYESVFTGFIRGFDLPGTSASFTLKDERLNLERKIGRNYLSQDDFPYMDKDGVLIPLTYGNINKGKTICLNQEDDTTSVYVFKFSDTTLHPVHSITQVYVDDKKIDHDTEDLDNGTFELSSSIYEDGQDVTVSFYGYVDDDGELIDNALDIIKDLLFIYDDKTYNSNNYYTDEWEEQRDLAPDCNICLQKTQTLIKTITTILSGFGATFKITGDGRFTIKKVDFDKESVKVINSQEIFGDVDENNDADGYLSSVRVGYALDYSTDEYSYYNNDSYEEELYLKNKSYVENDFEAYLTNKSDAQSYSETIMEIYGGIFTEFSFTTGIQNADLDIEDNIKVYVKKDENNERYYKMEVISISMDLTDYQMEIIGRFIQEILLPDYFIVEWIEEPEYIIEWAEDVDHVIEYWD